MAWVLGWGHVQIGGKNYALRRRESVSEFGKKKERGSQESSKHWGEASSDPYKLRKEGLGGRRWGA